MLTLCKNSEIFKIICHWGATLSWFFFSILLKWKKEFYYLLSSLSEPSKHEVQRRDHLLMNQETWSSDLTLQPPCVTVPNAHRLRSRWGGHRPIYAWQTPPTLADMMTHLHKSTKIKPAVAPWRQCYKQRSWVQMGKMGWSFQVNEETATGARRAGPYRGESD